MTWLWVWLLFGLMMSEVGDGEPGGFDDRRLSCLRETADWIPSFWLSKREGWAWPPLHDPRAEVATQEGSFRAREGRSDGKTAPAFDHGTIPTAQSHLQQAPEPICLKILR